MTIQRLTGFPPLPQFYDENLARNDQEKLGLKGSSDPASCSLEKLLQQVKTAQSKRYGNLSKQKTLYEAVDSIRQYASIGDVMIQHQPHITALVWGSARLILQASTPCIFRT